MKEIKLRELERSYENGVIRKEEFEKKKKEIETMPEEKQQEEKEEKEHKLMSDKILIMGAVALIIIFAAFFIFASLTKEKPETIEDLHALNLKGKLKLEQGYIYNDAYSFVKLDDFWYTQLVSESGMTEFNFNFRYSPRELEGIQISGFLDRDKFNNATQYYATFNPLGEEFTHIRLARLDYDIQMTQVFRKIPISACDRDTNQTTACLGIPIITCDNTEDIVVYYKESDALGVEYGDNCIIISGREFDFVRGVDRVLYNLYGIMEQ